MRDRETRVRELAPVISSYSGPRAASSTAAQILFIFSRINWTLSIGNVTLNVETHLDIGVVPHLMVSWSTYRAIVSPEKVYEAVVTCATTPET